MSHPTAISPEEQEQIARQIGVLLLQGAPEDWQQITVEYRATGEYHDLLAEAARQDGSTEPWDPPEELLGIFEHLREGMYRPDVGTWLSALYIVERPSSYRIDINFDEEPQWQQPLPRAAYVDELRRYPRSDDNVPDWMREKLDGSVSSGTPQVPPGAGASAPAVDPGEDGTGPMPRANGSSHFRTARVFDDADEQGRPLITTRMPIPPEDSAALRQYLENAPVVLAAQDNEPDQLDPNQPSVVPGTWHTDGVWLWQGAVAYYLAQYGVPPEPELVEHARSRRFGFTEIDDGTRDAAVGVLMAPAGVDAGEFGSEDTASGPSGVDPTGLDTSAPDTDGPGTQQSTDVADSPAPDQSVVDPGAAGFTTDADLGPRRAAPRYPVATGSDTTLIGDTVEDSAHLIAAEQAAPEQPSTADAGPVEADDTTVQPAMTSLQNESAPAEPAPAEQAWIDGPDADLADNPDGFAEDSSDGGEDARAMPERAQDDLLADAPAEPVEATGAARHGRSDEDDEVDSADSEAIFDDLRVRLDGLGVEGDGYRIGERSDTTWSLHDEGSDWVVAGPRASHGEVRFERPEQAAAYLLGSLLMAQGPAPVAEPRQPEEQSAEPETPAPSTAAEAALLDAGGPADDHSPLGEPEAARNGSGETRQTSQASPDSPGLADLPRRTQEPAPSETGGNFLFTANETRQRQAAEAAGEDPDFAGNGAAPGASHQEPAVPPATPPAPPIGQPAQAPPPVVPGPNGAPPAGQAPPPLPKRAPRSDRGGAAAPPPDSAYGSPAASQQAPRQAAPGGNPPPPPAGPDQRPDQRRGPGAPPAPGAPARQGPPQPGPSGAPNRPQQAGAPGPQPAPGAPPASNRGPEQPIQPLQGEPPLTLFRDRRTIMLQPGTDIDRFGDPNGNVMYAAHTPYNQRSLPPQWANRTFFAYRVQRPVQVLRGTAVPWFEQPGGGTAYVLPVAVSDLLADGTLVALSGAEAPPRPPLE